MDERFDSIVMCLAFILMIVLSMVFGEGCSSSDRQRLEASSEVVAAERALDKRYEAIKVMCLYEMTREDVSRSAFGMDWMRCVRREMGI